MTLRAVPVVRTASTKYWGAVGIPALVVGYPVAFNSSAPWAWVAMPLVGVGAVGLLLSARSAFYRQRAQRAATLDEREIVVLRRAHIYAFRGLAAAAVSAVFYASMATQSDHRWWMPADSRAWRSVLWPLVLGLPTLPAVIAEWLDEAGPEQPDRHHGLEGGRSGTRGV